MTVMDELLALYAQRGARSYFGEAVSMMEHGLQAAHFARSGDAPPALVVAALLHDIGHLIAPAPDDIGEWTRDAGHEVSGGRWLAARFGPEVSEPVRLHVPAKRYLCATDPAYFEQLSHASLITLKLQGGPMSAPEVARFKSQPRWREAVLVRRCDDAGKQAGLQVSEFEHYRPIIEQLAFAHARGTAA